MAVLPYPPWATGQRRVGKRTYPQLRVATVEAVVLVAYKPCVAVFIGIYYSGTALRTDNGNHRSYTLVDDFGRHTGRVAPLLDIDCHRQLQVALLGRGKEIGSLPHAVAVETEEMVGTDFEPGAPGGKVVAQEGRVIKRKALAGLEVDKVDAGGGNRVEIGGAIVGRDIEAAHRVARIVDLDMRLARPQYAPQGHTPGKYRREHHKPYGYRPGTSVAEPLHTTNIRIYFLPGKTKSHPAAGEKGKETRRIAPHQGVGPEQYAYNHGIGEQVAAHHGHVAAATVLIHSRAATGQGEDAPRHGVEDDEMAAIYKE